MQNKPNNKVEEIMLEFRKLLEEAHINIYTDGIPMFKFLRKALTSSYEQGREDEKERITKIVEKWMETSNPAHAQDLFDSLKNN